MGCSLRNKVEHFKDNAAFPFLIGLAKKGRIYLCRNIFFPTILADLYRNFFKHNGGLVAF